MKESMTSTREAYYSSSLMGYSNSQCFKLFNLKHVICYNNNNMDISI